MKQWKLNSMPDGIVLTPEDFWQFSLGHYAQAGVEPACLSLQNDFGGNVNLALLLHWLDCQQLSLSNQLIQNLIDTASHSDSLLRQYRTMRKNLKPQLDHDGYQQLLRFELTLEKQQQSELITKLNTSTSPFLPSTHTPNSCNLERYCHQVGADILLLPLQANTP
ncbi:TIGR02444 family protein [Photobacterium marinum]|nr:TIGR02444 family protein [Photobacterium marinum]